MDEYSGDHGSQVNQGWRNTDGGAILRIFIQVRSMPHGQGPPVKDQPIRLATPGRQEYAEYPI